MKLKKKALFRSRLSLTQMQPDHRMCPVPLTKLMLSYSRVETFPND